jgi:hypothetical protein
MAQFDPQHIITCPGIILWDGISTPNIDEKDGAVSHSLKIAIPENAPERAELEQLAMATLQSSEFKGQFPAGGVWPFQQIDVAKFGDSAPLLHGRVAISAKTRNGVPGIYDVNGQQLSAMQFGRMLYAGAHVQLLVHCYAFNNKSRGLAFGLDGVMIVDATAPKLDVGGGLSQSQVAAAFGARPGVAPAGMPPMAGMPPTHAAPYGMPPVAGGAAAPAPFAPPAPSAPSAVLTGMPPSMAPGAPVPGASPATTFPSSPHTAFVTNAAAPAAPVPSARQMTAKAGGHTYEQLVAGGWTDETLRQHGYML